MAMSRLPSLRRDKNYAQHRGGSIASWLHKEVVAWCPSNFVDLYPPTKFPAKSKRWEFRRSISTEGSTPRPGRRVLSVALGPHHKPFESARTARGLFARNPVGALHALSGAQSAVKRAKKASIMIGERYKTDTTSVFRAVREG